MSGRTILHIDCNAFYASVEELLHPEYKAVPMAICGDPESRRGIILAKNQLAKEAGVQTAETIWQARRKCPDLRLARARHTLYMEYSQQVNAIYDRYTDRVERFGIDESYLDITDSMHLFGGDGERIAHEIRERVKRETGLTVSVGVSFNKTFAKIGSDYKKPDAVTCITQENYRDIVWPLPAAAMMMVGKVHAQQLLRMNLHTIGDVAQTPEETLRRRLGKIGEQLHACANGLDHSAVLLSGEHQPAQSIGNGITFRRDLVSEADIRVAVTALADNVATRLRRAGLSAGAVQVTIKNPELKVITRQQQLKRYTHLAADLSQAAMELILASWRPDAPIRMLAVTAQRLLPEEEVVQQLSLFESQEEGQAKQEALEQAMDRIRSRYGSGSIASGSLLKNDLGIQEE